MISQTAEYALRAVVSIAQADGEPRTTRELAEITQVPSGYLAKVLQSLTRAGLIRSQRGLGGGFTLERPAEKLSVLDVLQAVDPIRRIRTCPLKIATHRDRLCPLHQQLDDALAAIEASFRDSFIADLVDRSKEQQPLCHNGPCRGECHAARDDAVMKNEMPPPNELHDTGESDPEDPS